MADINIHRTESGDGGTFGVWTNSDGMKLAVTVERPPTGDHPCIPKGIYPWKKIFSPHNGECFLLEDVPGRSMIEIHVANTMDELRGCIAPGLRFAPFAHLKGVIHSKDTLKQLLIIYNDSGDIEIT